jgi:cytochrome b involved in lipid metabolism
MVKLIKIIFYFLTFSYSLLAEDRIITEKELIAHSSQSSCWIKIDKNIYNITDYISIHQEKFKYNLTKWCGKDSTKSWVDKDGKKKGHSRKAKNLLKKYQIGILDVN